MPNSPTTPCAPLRQGWQAAAALALCLGWLPSYADAVQEYAAKSVLALNLARYSDWPAGAFEGNGGATVNLCLLGDAVVRQAFAMIDNKQVGDKTLAVHNIGSGKELEHCQLLFVSADTGITGQVFDESYKRHVLTIGEADGFLAQGGMVYLEMLDSKINLHVNLAATQKAGVQISSRVLKLATIFNP